MPKLHKVEVQVPQRQEFHGFWAAGSHLTPGKHTLEDITTAQMRELREVESVGHLLISGEPEAKGEDEKAPVSHGDLSESEKALIAAHRSQNAKPAQPQAYASHSPSEGSLLKDEEFTHTDAKGKVKR